MVVRGHGLRVPSSTKALAAAESGAPLSCLICTLPTQPNPRSASRRLFGWNGRELTCRGAAARPAAPAPAPSSTAAPSSACTHTHTAPSGTQRSRASARLGGARRGVLELAAGGFLPPRVLAPPPCVRLHSMGLLLALNKPVDHVSHAIAYGLGDGAARGREVLHGHARDLRRQLQGCNVSHLFVRNAIPGAEQDTATRRGGSGWGGGGWCAPGPPRRAWRTSACGSGPGRSCAWPRCAA